MALLIPSVGLARVELVRNSQRERLKTLSETIQFTGLWLNPLTETIRFTGLCRVVLSMALALNGSGTGRASLLWAYFGRVLWLNRSGCFAQWLCRGG